MRGAVNSLCPVSGGGGVELSHYKIDSANSSITMVATTELKKVVVNLDTSLMSAGSVEIKDNGVTVDTITESNNSYSNIFFTSTTLSVSTSSDFSGAIYFSSQDSSGKNEVLGELTVDGDNVQADVSENTLASMLLKADGASGSIVVDRGFDAQDYVFENETIIKNIGMNQSTSFTLKPYEELSGSVYDNKRLDIGTQEGNIYSITLNSDGSKFFILGISSDTIYQFSLNETDISLSTYDGVSFSVTAQDSTPRRIIFNSDYSKFYMVGSGSDSIHQYSITDDSDISTASYDSVSFSISAQDLNPYSIMFSSDYSKIYMLGNANKRIYQYTMGAGWDISLSSYDGVSFYFGSQDIYPYDFLISPDGSNLYVLGLENGNIYEYTMDQSDISNCSYSSSTLPMTEMANPTAMCFSANNTKLLIGALDDYIYQYSFGKPISGTTYISLEY